MRGKSGIYILIVIQQILRTKSYLDEKSQLGASAIPLQQMIIHSDKSSISLLVCQNYHGDN